MPDQRNSIYKGPGDGGTEMWPLWLEQSRGVGRGGDIGKVIRNKRTQGLKFLFGF